MQHFNIFFINHKLMLFKLSLALVLSLGGCSTTMDNMTWVNQGIEQKRLVPEEAVEVADVLNQYPHDYPAPTNKALGLYIDTDKPRLVTQGGEVLVQVGIKTRQPPTGPVQLHLLVYDEDGKQHAKQITEIIAAAKQQIIGLPGGSALTVDTAFKSGQPLQYQALINTPADDLHQFIAHYALAGYKGKHHHFILVLGNYDKLNREKRQDMVDMANIFRAKGMRLSVLSYADKPDFTLLQKIANNADGNLTLVNQYLDIPDWLAKEIARVHAYDLTDVKLTLNTSGGVKIVELLSPGNLEHHDKQITLKLDKLGLQQTYVMLAKLQVPAMQNQPYRRLFQLKASYFDPHEKRFQNRYKNHSIQYVMNRNDALPVNNRRIERSQLILHTFDTIKVAASKIRESRNYQAIALLTDQSRALDTYTQQHRDPYLQRDADILNKYAANLHDFDQEWLQFWSIKKDLDWDKSQYTETYR